MKTAQTISPATNPTTLCQSLFLCLVFLLSACGPGETGHADDSPEAAAARGKRVYAVNCTSCHHPDPAKPGSLGPAVKGSSRALIEARLLRAEYPPGYAPKRDSSAMPAMPHLAPKIDDLAAYLK